MIRPCPVCGAINRDHAIEKIKLGYMIGFGPETAEIGRKFTKRQPPYLTRSENSEDVGTCGAYPQRPSLI
jgi:hypothetical protein